jgi:putative transport protein
MEAGPAKALLMELGLVLFMAEVGLKAGSGVGEALADVGPEIFGAGVIITLVPVLVAYAVGRHALKLNPAILLGSITGAMTSTPALNVLTEATRSPVPGLGYAGTYTFANVLPTFAGTLLVRI